MLVYGLAWRKPVKLISEIYEDDLEERQKQYLMARLGIGNAKPGSKIETE